MALPQHLQKYRGLVELIAAAVARKIEAEREANTQSAEGSRAACLSLVEPVMNSTAQQN
jgi:hypothetical protein